MSPRNMHAHQINNNSFPLNFLGCRVHCAWKHTVKMSLEQRRALVNVLFKQAKMCAWRKPITSLSLRLKKNVYTNTRNPCHYSFPRPSELQVQQRGQTLWVRLRKTKASLANTSSVQEQIVYESNL